MEQISQLILNNGVAIAIVIVIVVGVWKAAPKIADYMKGFLDEIRDNNTRLTVAYEKMGEDFKTVKNDVSDLKKDVADLHEEVDALKGE